MSSHLPVHLGGRAQGSTGSQRGGKYFRRLLNFRQMDFELALSQMFYLCVSPQRVYRNFYYHKRTKNQWARDDPAFVVLLSLFLCVSSVGCAVVFGLSFLQFVRLLLWVVFIDCIGTGCVVATLLWFLSNKFLKAKVMAQYVEQSVEWGYAFDVHCNAFFPLLMVIHVLQLFLIKVIARDWFISAVIADTMWLVAISYYVYITFLGYSALPFLKKTVALLYPIAGFIVVYFIAVLFQWNISLAVFEFYGFNPSGK